MTLFQIEELTSYWAQHPPLHLLIAAYLGVVKNKTRRPPATPTRRGQRPGSEIDSMVAQLSPVFSAGDVHAGLSPVVLDFAELRLRAGFPD